MNFNLKPFTIDINVSKMANLHYFEFIKEYHTFKDKHPFRELVYVDSGKINIESEGYCGALYEKQLIIHKANEIHSLSCPDDISPNVIIIGFECDCERLDFFSKNVCTLSNELTRILSSLIREGRLVYMPPYDVPNLKDMKKRLVYPFGADQMIKIKLESFLIELVRSVEAPPLNQKDPYSGEAKIEEVYAYINNNYSEKITLSDLCFLFGTNKTTLCKSFKRIYGETIINYINKLRINKAKKLIRDGNLSITDLSLSVGFSSIHYFSKIFKSIEKQPPSEYIKTIKSKLDM